MAPRFFRERKRSATAALHDFNGAGVGTPVVTQREAVTSGRLRASMEPGLVPRLLRSMLVPILDDEVASMEPGLVPRLLPRTAFSAAYPPCFNGAGVGTPVVTAPAFANGDAHVASMEPGLVPRLLLGGIGISMTPFVLQWSRGWYPGCYFPRCNPSSADSGFNGAGVGTPVVTVCSSRSVSIEFSRFFCADLFFSVFFQLYQTAGKNEIACSDNVANLPGFSRELGVRAPPSLCFMPPFRNEEAEAEMTERAQRKITLPGLVESDAKAVSGKDLPSLPVA